MLKTRLVFLLSLIAWAPAFLGQNSSDFDWKAFHRANDREWAARTGLPAENIRRLRLAAGIQDDEELNPIDRIDAKTLGRHRVLLVTAAGSGHCLTVAVYQPHGRGYRELWSASEMPHGGGFCHPSLCRSPGAIAAKHNQVIVRVPAQLEGAKMGVCDETTLLTYKGAGKTYILTKTETVAERCHTEDYLRAVSEAFAPENDPDGSEAERVVTVFILPSFGVESAITIEKTANGIEVDRLGFREKLWQRLAIYDQSQTPSQCIAEAKSLPIDKTPLSISAGDARRLVDELNKIDRNADSCPRQADGSCAHILHGTIYRVAFPDGQIVQLQNVKGGKGVRSENQALLDWIHKLLLYLPAQ